MKSKEKKIEFNGQVSCVRVGDANLGHIMSPRLSVTHYSDGHY